VQVALDDFGTGFSSLDYLRRFPVDVIKLDKSFTDELPSGERALQLVESIARLAADMGASTQAEGVETAAQASCLQSLGWAQAQGYLFSRPEDADTIGLLLARARHPSAAMTTPVAWESSRSGWLTGALTPNDEVNGEVDDLVPARHPPGVGQFS
jgi:predicted signal transduction protein with EAL and GGDEF domain